MKFAVIFIFYTYYKCVFGDTRLIEPEFNGVEEQKMYTITEIIVNNLKNNGWNNILFVGRLPDILYHRLKNLPYTFVITDTVDDDEQIEDMVPYHSNIIIINCNDFEEFENALIKLVTLAYWDPLANIILYLHAPYKKIMVAKIFFIFWFYRAINVIVVQYDDNAQEMFISHFTPYISESYKLDNLFGCWKAKKIGMPIYNFEEGFVCVHECHNVTKYSKLRANFLGTCIGFDTEVINSGSVRIKKSLFEDKAKNLHGFALLAYAAEVLPFLVIKELADGTHTFHNRDGMIWSTMAELFNFTIDIYPSRVTMKEKFDFEVNILQVFSFTQRKADLILFPLYQFDLIIAEVDYTVPFLDSGVCVLSHRAEYETIVFDEKLVRRNMFVIIEYFVCFLLTWFVFFIFNTEQSGRLNLDRAGKDLMNAFRTVLSISLYSPPTRGSFRIFLMISIWSFFVINFSTQAAIISLFSVHKRGKEVDTFQDVIEKGYKIEGMATPDIVLPETDETFRIISSRMEAVHDLFECVNQMGNDSRRFCLIDCAVGHYLVRNMLNYRGEQFLHLASDARIHSHYLNMILHKDSPMTENFNKYIMAFFEAGLIRKWMDYRYVDMNEESPVKSLGMEELGGIFQLYGLLLGISSIFFVIELILGILFWLKCICSKVLKRTRKLFSKNIGT